MLDLDPNYYVCKELDTAVFSYRVRGLLAGSSAGNYYLLENDQKFRLVWDGKSRLFCLPEDKDIIQQYYAHAEEPRWFYLDFEKDVQIPLTPDAEQAMRTFLTYDIAGMPKIEVTSDEAADFYIEQTSSDGIVVEESYDFVLIDESLYLVQRQSYDGNTTTYEAIPMPEEMNAVISGEI